ncbi:tyrosine-type recombinase/integrase [Burkholderia pseudomallei]|uniref:tyrosine-type recombinase/integrase n=2 Tax=Burkholderia pseudomallei TaxID=28450 RepID=UPI001364D587|nr:tyrosine-type recombinase/integrase [Burkholderia pseudomallei]MBF3434167.1 site-specific integrase [Burkholderia pseudomallei]MBF3452383.1 site-specific integrase [Burkholderia pseudomallei]MBF3476243.1 site-specific integrase [Burkholderia pseudomallei]MBF3482952.1 site-specific integrase [Burkholderia pseudomallei]MBF3492473.1 site-specific integrase [Burkholderia pseudomallei]
MNLNGLVWKFNVVATHTAIDWSSFADCNVIVNYALRRWAVLLLAQQSGLTVANGIRIVVGALRGLRSESDIVTGELQRMWRELYEINEPSRLRIALRIQIEKAIQVLRARKAMDAFYVLRNWYLWSSEMLDCLGFDEEFALELDEVQIPARPSRLAVELEDEACGPLWDTEVAILRRALLDDVSMVRLHIMQRAAVTLSLAYGRNPTNFCLLRETDLRNALAGFDVPEQWMLAIPRIKKPGVGVRQAFIEERVSDELAGVLRKLLDANQAIDCGDCPRPLFMRENIDRWRQDTGIGEYGYHITVEQFRLLIKQFAQRMNLLSPRTKRALYITSRRLRYTFATTMVELGVSRKVLAAMLDHSDTQHVQVYYSLKGRRLTTILDRAAALRIGPLMRLFRGTLVPSAASAANGSDPAKSIRFVGDMSAVPPVEIGACGQDRLCALDPPFSCYVCPKFQPYVEADHQAVLNELLASRREREQRYGARLSIQLDDVIYAVAEVIRKVDEYVRGRRKKA